MEIIKGNDSVRVNGIAFDTRMSKQAVDEKFDAHIRKITLFGGAHRFGTRGQFIVFTSEGIYTDKKEKVLGVMEGAFEEVLYACMRIHDFGRIELSLPTPVDEVFKHIPAPAFATTSAN